MSDTTPVVHDFDSVVAEVAATGDSRAITFSLGGDEFTIPSPLDWSDDVVELQAAAGANPGAANPVALAKAFLGEEQYKAFRDAGGSAMKFMKFFERVMGGQVGESPAS